VSAHTRQLAQRRAALLQRSRRLRFELAQDAAPLAQRLRLADRILAVDRWDLARMLLSAGTTLFVFRRTRRVLRIAARLLTLYPVVRPLVARLRRRR
jgi:hypothetical protein